MIKPLEMDPEIRDRWTEALRSDEYEQTVGSLCDGTGFCCLGVLCDLAYEEGIIEVRRDEGDQYAFDYSYSELPDKVREWAGLDDCDPEFRGRCLSEWNDEERLNFRQIADLIDGRPMKEVRRR